MICIKLRGEGALRVAQRCRHLHGGAFRAPHHTASAVALQEELSMAMGGVLYLDIADVFPAAGLKSLIKTWCRLRSAGGKVPILIAEVVGDKHAELWPSDTVELELSKAEVDSFCRIIDALRGES